MSVYATICALTYFYIDTCCQSTYVHAMVARKSIYIGKFLYRIAFLSLKALTCLTNWINQPRE